MKRIFNKISLLMILGLFLVGCNNTTENISDESKKVVSEDVKEEETNNEENSEEKSDGNKTKLTFWCHENEPWILAYEEMAKKFEEENPEYEVVVESYPMSVYGNKIQTALTDSSTAPDVIAVWGGMAPAYIQSDGLAEVPSDLVKELEDDYMSPTLGIYKKGGNYYGVPMEFNLEYGGMIVNKKMFEETGNEYPTTWGELRKLSQELSVSNGDIVEVAGFQMHDTDSLICNYLAMILQQGGQYLNEDGTIDFATNEGIVAMEEILDTIDKKESGLDNLVNGEYCFHNTYQDKAYMSSAGSWAIGEGSSYDLEFGKDYDYIPVPQYGKENGFASETGWGIIVPSNGENLDAAWEYVKFFSKPENLVEHNIACNQLPPRKSLLDNERYKEAMPQVDFLLEILPYGQWMGPYNTSTMREIFNEGFINLAQSNNRDVKGVLQGISEEINNTAKISYSNN